MMNLTQSITRAAEKLRRKMKWHSRDAMPRGVTVAALAALIVLGNRPSKGDEAGLYSDAQALRGQALFDEHCPACHGAQLQGSAAVALS